MKEKLALTLLLCGATAFGQTPSGPGVKKARTADDYQLRTLREVVATVHTGSEVRQDGRKDMVLRGDILPSRVRVAYAGLTRPLPGSKKDVIQAWARRFAGSPEHYTRPYETEALFTEDGTEYWLAVHKKLLPQAGEGSRKGEVVDLFVIRLGGVRTQDVVETVILVESLRKPE